MTLSTHHTTSHDRGQVADDFLTASGWAGAQRRMLAGDASFRKYERVTLGEKRAVLMDAPPDKEDIAPFCAVGRYLETLGLSAPHIIAQDNVHGFLLLEDLGDNLVSRVLQGKHDFSQDVSEMEIYIAAAEVLVELHRTREGLPSWLMPYDREVYLREVSLLPDWFMPLVAPKQQANLRVEFMALWEDILSAHPLGGGHLVLRDYHADNLLWLPERQGVKKCGLLDFQDALAGSAAYDMVSYLEDARRDVDEATVQEVLKFYLTQTRQDAKRFMNDYAILGAQRNCKIIGIFCRLAARDGKENYLSYLPRVWKHLERDLEHIALKPLKEWLTRHVAKHSRGVIALPKRD